VTVIVALLKELDKCVSVACEALNKIGREHIDMVGPAEVHQIEQNFSASFCGGIENYGKRVEVKRPRRGFNEMPTGTNSNRFDAQGMQAPVVFSGQPIMLGGSE